MIDATNVTSQVVADKGTVLFDSTRIYTGCSARHESGSGRFVLLRPGVYEVSFDANVSLPAGATVTPIVVNITQDGEAVAGSRMVFTPAAAGTVGGIHATVLIRVYEQGCCVALGVRNDTGAAIDVQDANLVITRHC